MSGDINPKEQRDFNRRLIALLESRGIAYGIGGSVAAMAYSDPRLTVDVDLMIDVELPDLQALIAQLEIDGLYVDPFEGVLEYHLPHGHPFGIADGSIGTRADIYVSRRAGLDVAAMGRRRQLMLYTAPLLEAWFLSPEDVILYKLDYFRQSEGTATKHSTDIAKMLAIQGANIDDSYIEQWARRLAVHDLWQALWSAFHSDAGA